MQMESQVESDFSFFVQKDTASLRRLCSYVLADLDCPAQKHKQASANQQQKWDTNLPNTRK